MSAVPGADPLTGQAMDPGHRKKKKKGGKKKEEESPPPVEESTSGHEGGSESSLHDNLEGQDHSSQYEKGQNEKLTDDSSLEDHGDDTLTTLKGSEGVNVRTDMPISAAQLDISDPTLINDEVEKGPIELWLDSHTEHPWKGFSADLRRKIVEFLEDHAASDYDPIHMRNVRETIWRGIVRANYWWINPDTGEWSGRPRAVNINDGVYLGNFEAFVQCCAERQDRIGRDLATHEYVRKVEEDVREFIFRAENAGLHRQLEHLGFLLMFDEVKRHPHEVSLVEMQERICMAFAGSGGKMNWKGLQYMKGALKPPRVTNNAHPGIGEIVWKAALAEL